MTKSKSVLNKIPKFWRAPDSYLEYQTPNQGMSTAKPNASTAIKPARLCQPNTIHTASDPAIAQQHHVPTAYYTTTTSVTSATNGSDPNGSATSPATIPSQTKPDNADVCVLKYDKFGKDIDRRPTLDSGATHHITPYGQLLCDVKTTPVGIVRGVTGNSTVKAQGCALTVERLHAGRASPGCSTFTTSSTNRCISCPTYCTGVY